MEKDKLLSFEEFIRPDKMGIPRYNNFPGNWGEGMIGRIYRNSSHALRFQKEYPELDKKLLEKHKTPSAFLDKEKKEFEKLS